MRVVVLIALALLLACSKKESASEPETGAATEAQTAEAEPTPGEGAGGGEGETEPELPDELKGPTPAVDSAPVIKVVDSGEGERSELVLNVEPGTKQELTMEVRYMAEASVGGTFPVHSPLQQARYVLLLEAGKKTPDGAVPVRISVDDVQLIQDAVGESKERAKRTKAALKAMKAIRGSYILSPAGRVSAVELDLPDNTKVPRLAYDLVDNLRWALSALLPPLPSEPVAKGAEWTAHRGIELGGHHINELSTHRLVERNGNQATIESAPVQAAEAQVFKNPGSPAELELISFQNEGSQKVTWDLTKPAPDEAEVKLGTMAGVLIKDAPDKESTATAILAQRVATVPAQ